MKTEIFSDNARPRVLIGTHCPDAAAHAGFGYRDRPGQSPGRPFSCSWGRSGCDGIGSRNEVFAPPLRGPGQREAAGRPQEFGEQVFVRAVVSACESTQPVAQ